MPSQTTRLDIPIPALGDTEWKSEYTAAFDIVDEALGQIVQAGGLTFIRIYDTVGAAWPERGDLPATASVIWVKPDPANPNPATGGTGVNVALDLIVAAVV